MNKREKEKKKKENKKWKKMMAPALALVKQRERAEDGTCQLENRYGTHGKEKKREKDRKKKKRCLLALARPCMQSTS